MNIVKEYGGWLSVQLNCADPNAIYFYYLHVIPGEAFYKPLPLPLFVPPPNLLDIASHRVAMQRPEEILII
jgi:hypothetical protein